MRAVELRHTPAYFQFYIQDPDQFGDSTNDSYAHADEDRFVCDEGRITVLVQSELSEIPIAVESHDSEPTVDGKPIWDRIVQCPLEVASGRIVFCGCPDGPIYGRFGEVPAEPGNYVVRVYYGGQRTRGIDGRSKDFYKIEIWRGYSEKPEVIRPTT
jgi:hypothetical protein